MRLRAMKTLLSLWREAGARRPAGELGYWQFPCCASRRLDRDRPRWVDRIACSKRETRCAMAADPTVKAKEPIAPGQEIEAEATPLVVWAARLSLYFLAQGGILLLSYAYYGFNTDPHSFPLGFKLDPIHAAVHFVWGLVGSYIGFFQPRYATAFVLAFAVFYTVMAVLGTFTPYHFGMMLDEDA